MKLKGTNPWAKKGWTKKWDTSFSSLPSFLLSQEYLEYPLDPSDPKQRDVVKEKGYFTSHHTIFFFLHWTNWYIPIFYSTIDYRTYWWALWANISRTSWQTWIALKQMKAIPSKSPIIQYRSKKYDMRLNCMPHMIINGQNPKAV